MRRSAILFLIACKGPKDSASDSENIVDLDGDGVMSDIDCDDGDASVYPGAPITAATTGRPTAIAAPMTASSR